MSADEQCPQTHVPDMQEYVLAGILGSNVSMILNWRARIVTQLIEGGIEAQCLLTEQEMRTISVLLEALPSPCSYVVIYAAVTEVPQELADYLFADVDDEVRALVLEVLRPVLQRCRRKLLVFNLGIEHLQGKGYQLIRL